MRIILPLLLLVHISLAAQDPSGLHGGRKQVQYEQHTARDTVFKSNRGQALKMAAGSSFLPPIFSAPHQPSLCCCGCCDHVPAMLTMRPHTQVANIRRETQGRKARLKRIRVKDTVAHIVTDGSRAADANRKDPSSVAGSGHPGASADGLHSQLDKDPLRAASVDTGPAFWSAGDRTDPVSGAVRSFPSARVEAQGAEPNRTTPTVAPADMGLAPWNATTPEGCVRQSSKYTACTSVIMCARRGTCPAASVAMQWLCGRSPMGGQACLVSVR